ncbi:MAG TPA: hypothetical protein VFU02_05725 [Polyangiaceae bacterium]|nr:hypothetical protein [Polyangiaceae bacterium]
MNLRASPAGALALALGLSGCLLAPAVHAQYRRPGLGGQWSQRNLTAPTNSLAVVLGPGQTVLLGQRYGEDIIDGGAEYTHLEYRADGSSSPDQDIWFGRAGVLFGLTDDWEAGALFLPMQLSPDFGFSSILAYGTHGFRFEDVDLGIRLSFLTPSSQDSESVLWFRGGVPVSYRAGPLRVDTGAFVPLAFRHWWLGLSTPVRATFNVLPSLFVGVESGFDWARFTLPHSTSVPLGGIAGYTFVIGSSVVDLTAAFSWPTFWLPDPSPGLDSLQPDAYRVSFGLVVHKLVK